MRRVWWLVRLNLWRDFMDFLENMKQNNQFPIIFIGSGITQRYFSNAPTWDKLLQMLWGEIDTTKTYFARYKELQNEFGKDTFKIYTTLADELEMIFDDQFLDGKIKLENLTPEKAHNNQISPFKTKIAAIFSTLIQRKKNADELKAFKAMLAKSRLIVTTNYDDFIEKQLNNAIKIRIGNQGLFESAGDLNELYKIHGSVKDPNSIMITSADYEKMKRTSAIVNAKILSLLTESPILFIGYSLTDKNIQSLLSDLAENMPYPIEKAAKRIGVVQYEQGQPEIVETMRNTDYGVHYTQLSTDNFAAVYSAVSKIDQGFSPLEISKYKNAFKQILDIKGQSGELKQVLTSFVNLEDLPHELKKKNLVVALGDERYLYKFPDYVDYIKAYFLEENPIPREVAIKFIISMPAQSPLPISKYLKQDMDLSGNARKKLNKRLSKFATLADIQEKVSVAKKNEGKLRGYSGKSAVEIFKMKDDIKATAKLAFFIKHIKEIDAEALVNYLLKNEGDNFLKETNTRKLFMAYSLLTEKIFDKV